MKLFFNLTLYCTLCLMAIVTASCDKQEQTRSSIDIMASIEGTVRDAKGFLPWVEVKLLPTGERYITAENGRYAFKNLKDGLYFLHAKANAYNEYTSDTIHVCSGKIIWNIELQKEDFSPREPELTQDYSDTSLNLDLDMVYVKGGMFIQGSKVKVDSYHISKYEITQSQWNAVMGTSLRNQADKSGYSELYGEGAHYPMYYVSWNEANEFCAKLSAYIGKRYVLPTAAQWEYAARGGILSRSNVFSGDNCCDSVAWHDGNSGAQTHEVGMKHPNELGLYDMSGNVLEWCLDWYAAYNIEDYYNPTGPENGDYRVVRGDSWFNYARYCGVSLRYSYNPNYRDYAIGFRVVCLP